MRLFWTLLSLVWLTWVDGADAETMGPSLPWQRNKRSPAVTSSGADRAQSAVVMLSPPVPYPHLRIRPDPASAHLVRVTDVVGQSTVVQIDEGQTLNLTCSVVTRGGGADDAFDDDAGDDYELNWYLSGYLFDRLSQFKERNAYRVIIRSVTQHDSGQFRCTGRRIGGRRRRPSSPSSTTTLIKKVIPPDEMKRAIDRMLSYDDDDNFNERLIDLEDEDEEDEEEGHDADMLVQKLILKVKPNSSGYCGPSFFQCPQWHCIGGRFLCDGIHDCPDGSDESVSQCGHGDPCDAKLRCDDQRCMDPALCCDPLLHDNCTNVPKCCRALLESNRHFFQLGLDQRRKHEEQQRYYYSILMGVAGCVFILIVVLSISFFSVYRANDAGRLLLQRRIAGIQFSLVNSGQPNVGGGNSGPPSDLVYADIASSRAMAAGQPARTAGGGGITYNINNGIQFVGGGVGDARRTPPPPYPHGQQLRRGMANPSAEPPPPYEYERDSDSDDEDSEFDAAMAEANNNGDINGNSDMVNQNVLYEEQRRRQLLEDSERLRAQEPLLDRRRGAGDGDGADAAAAEGEQEDGQVPRR